MPTRPRSRSSSTSPRPHDPETPRARTSRRAGWHDAMSGLRERSRSALDDHALVGHTVRHGQARDVARTVLAQVRSTLQVGLGHRLAGQRLETSYVVGADAETLADALAELVLAHEQVPDHPLLDGSVALAQRADQVGHQVVLLPLLGEQVALTGLRVVVGPRDPLAGHPAHDLRALLVVARVLRLAQAAGDRRLVVHVWVGPAVVHGVGHLCVALVGAYRGALRPVHRELKVVRPDAVALGIAVAERTADQHLVVGEVQTVDEDTGAECNLLVLGEDV